ncbi:MAG: 50S ribosomal L9 C-terminal domain-containing protein [Candidatus Komeilibacteria bacterium]|nr:50S ribosomal L9 C-terminal domain-containing protein [Candidatus Komeilibacteria bacterium]
MANGLARAATVNALQLVSQAKQKKARVQEQKITERRKLYNILDKQVILIHSSANPEGVLFGGVDRAAIAAAIAKRKKIEINPKQLDLPHHLKTLGKHDVVLELGGGEKVKFIVDVQN